ncbi:uncharacterized protein LOC129302541 [Prosopis cineraria]|uniref:uncharacterized protein LOC129302541 n=1 Tax=Prosopis cineraria TaxID=364024 RepID=UPI00240EFBCD|nr:uncharacterized protein LOC129302541 [Prosopis cineraria]
MAKCILSSVLLAVLLLLAASLSSARLFNGVGLAATEPATVALALPSDTGVGAVNKVTASRVRSTKLRIRAVALPRRTGKYGPLVLNMLPKGTVPPSGPNPQIHNVNN